MAVMLPSWTSCQQWQRRRTALIFCQPYGMLPRVSTPPIGNVAVVVTDGVAPFELGVVCEAFGLDRRDDGVPLLDFGVCTPRPGRVRTDAGFDLHVEHGLDRATAADLVAVPAMGRRWVEGDAGVAALVAALVAAVERGARVLSLCSGAFVLGEAGLLDGRRCTTHWRHAAELSRRYPAAMVDPDVLYVEDGPVITSAGTAAGIDACLHLWRSDFGAATASAIARRMVVAPHREGGQAQFIREPLPTCDAPTLAPVLQWAVEHLGTDLSVARLAARAHMSERTFARRFRAETGATPHQWVTDQRLLFAEQLLETADQSVEHIARQAGFGTAAVLRHHFAQARGTSPQQYRRTFRGSVATV